VVHLIGGEEWFSQSKDGHGMLFTTASTGAASSPSDFMLMSLAACSGDTIKYLLEINKKTVNGIKVEVEGKWAKNPPRRFSEIRFKYTVDSPNVSQSDLIRVADAVLEKLSGVGNTLSGKPKLTTEVSLVKK
jgi:putative redox protein